MLKKAGFTVLLIDEFNTSSYCPTCESELEKFKTVVNPCPYKRANAPTITCHGLLRCRNLKCLDDGEHQRRKLWNRDMAAVLNFKKILVSLRETGRRPTIFCRKNNETFHQGQRFGYFMQVPTFEFNTTIADELTNIFSNN